MSDLSIFTDKQQIPNDQELSKALGPTYPLWQQIEAMVMQHYPSGKMEWNYPGKKYGWSYRIKDKRRAILYFLPREGYFKVAFVFGQKATDEIIASGVNDIVKEELASARVYAEGRGVTIKVEDEALFPDIERLVEIKLKY
ncbi:MAG TPA: hypothetical protein DDY13_05770 [Cytophagales bacterium]|jgi:hypothetical protein|nr:hypothetical protein [Cytophagales bacterium]